MVYDVLPKPIGFVGTLIFAYMIEKLGMLIVDQIANFLDLAWHLSVSKYSRIWLTLQSLK